MKREGINICFSLKNYRQLKKENKEKKEKTKSISKDKIFYNKSQLMKNNQKELKCKIPTPTSKKFQKINGIPTVPKGKLIKNNSNNIKPEIKIPKRRISGFVQRKKNLELQNLIIHNDKPKENKNNNENKSQTKYIASAKKYDKENKDKNIKEKINLNINKKVFVRNKSFDNNIKLYSTENMNKKRDIKDNNNRKKGDKLYNISKNINNNNVYYSTKKRKISKSPQKNCNNLKNVSEFNSRVSFENQFHNIKIQKRSKKIKIPKVNQQRRNVISELPLNNSYQTIKCVNYFNNVDEKKYLNKIYLNNIDLTNRNNFFIHEYDKENINSNIIYDNQLMNKYKYINTSNEPTTSDYNYRIPYCPRNITPLSKNNNFTQIDISDENRYCLCKDKIYRNKVNPILLTHCFDISTQSECLNLNNSNSTDNILDKDMNDKLHIINLPIKKSGNNSYKKRYSYRNNKINKKKEANSFVGRKSNYKDYSIQSNISLDLEGNKNKEKLYIDTETIKDIIEEFEKEIKEEEEKNKKADELGFNNTIEEEEEEYKVYDSKNHPIKRKVHYYKTKNMDMEKSCDFSIIQ
jgi:hypothetical protein